MSWKDSHIKLVYITCEECGCGAEDKNTWTLKRAIEKAKLEGFRSVKGKILCAECCAAAK